MTYRPTSRRQSRWKKAWTKLSKEAVWLAIVESCVVVQKVGYGRDPERVGRKDGGKAGGLEPPLHYAADVDGGDGIVRQILRLAQGGPK